MQGSFHNVRVVHLRKVFGQQLALVDVTIELNAGQISVLMGPNGAGKSTLLSLLSTASRPSSGDIFYGDLPQREIEHSMRQWIGVVAHAPLLYRDLSARENLRFFAQLYGLPNIEARIHTWLERTGLSHAADRPLREFSRGMIQRVALGRALLHEPRLLLLDEPFTALDREGVGLLRTLIADAAQRGAAVLLATHDTDAVDRLCQQQIVLRRGCVVAQTAKAQLSAAELVSCYHAAIGETVPATASPSPALATRVVRQGLLHELD